MAVSVVKASSCMIMNALRAIGSTKGIKINARSFSTCSKDCVDAALNKALESEINSPNYSNLQKAKAHTDTFPFDIKYGCFWRTLRLERNFPDEEVQVIIDLEKIEWTKEEASKKNTKAPIFIPMRVDVYKPAGCFSFEITVSTDDIIIQSLFIERYKKNGFITLIDGPRIRKMDHELQRALYKYVEIRGITSNIVSFLHKSKCISEMEKTFDFMSLEFLKTGKTMLTKEAREMIDKRCGDYISFATSIVDPTYLN